MIKEELLQIPFYIEDISGSENNTKLVNAQNLQLPATILANYCYQNKFEVVQMLLIKLK